MKIPLIECRVVAMKTKRYCYRLKGLDHIIGFRLEIHSEPHVLFNDVLRKNKNKKNTITISIQQIIKWSKERIQQPRIKEHTFFQIIKNEVGESSQKIFDRIFQLALERYAQLQHEGKMPTLISHRIPSQRKPRPRPAPRPRPTPTPRPERQPIETKQPIEKRITSDVDRHKALFKALIPKDLHDYFKIEYNPKDKTIVISIIQYLQHEKFMEIANISKRYQGTYNREKRCFSIPIEYLH